ncbi:MAG: diguanylate cyclase domain-containing protein [Parashewanella sp.]
MKGDRSTSASLNLLKKQLQNAKAEIKQLTLTRDDHFVTLASFISSLSQVCKGQNLELDNKLAKLRRNLSNFNALDKSIDDIVSTDKLLKGQYRQITLQLEEGRSSLSQAVCQLQRVTTLPDNVKRELTYFKQELKKPFHTVWDYIPQVNQLMSSYDKVLKLQFEDNNLELLPKHIALAAELSSLILDIEFSHDQKDKVETVKAILTQDLTVDDLFDCYQTILDLVVENLLREKSSSQEFLKSLNETLGVVGDIASAIKSNQKSTQQRKDSLNQEISNHVAIVDKTLAEGDTLEGLKAHINQQLEQLKDALQRKAQLENDEKKQLQLSLDSMTSELSSLNSELDGYKSQIEEQHKLSLTDPLTQLPNRQALEERMQLEHKRFQRQQNNLWIVVIDVDHFKSINDRFGHSIGDKTLQVIAKAFKSSLRETEFVARYGGEEFVLLLPNVPDHYISALLNRVREKIKSIPFKFKNQRITVTVSIGAANLIADETMKEAFDRADAALYRAKNGNRDQVIID